jgi:hypothetical protein
MAISAMYDKTNKGTLRKNDKKQEDWHPDYRGQVNVEGVEYWIDATLKQWDDGTRYMALKVRRKEPAAPPASSPASKPARSARPVVDELSDEIPF